MIAMDTNANTDTNTHTNAKSAGTGRRSLLGGAAALGLAGAALSTKAFAREGAHVGFCGRRAELGRQVEREIREAGGEATYIQADVRVAAQVRGFVNRVASRYGGIDVAFNNAGIGGGKLPTTSRI